MAQGAARPPVVPGTTREALDELARDVRQVFGDRLISLLSYGEPDADGTHTMALVHELTFADLTKCVPLIPRWRRMGLATPLVLTHDEFRRTLDVFPLEYGEIIAHHVLVTGSDPIAGIAVAESDLRRGCEQFAKSHLIHLREAFLETSGDSNAVAAVIAASAPAFRTLLVNLERLEPGAAGRAGIPDTLLREITSAGDATIAEPSALLSRYIAAVERIWRYVDAWR